MEMIRLSGNTSGARYVVDDIDTRLIRLLTFSSTAQHGTCCSTLDLKCGYSRLSDLVPYFNRIVALHKALPTYQWLTAAGITPSSTNTYTLAQLQAVARNNFGQEIVWNCRSGALNEAWYGYFTRGTIESGAFVAADTAGLVSNCPA